MPRILDHHEAMLDAAEHDARPRHELWWMPETMRIRALALSVTGDVEAALDVARAARALAAEQGSSLLLRRIDATIAALGGQPSR